PCARILGGGRRARDAAPRTSPGPAGDLLPGPVRGRGFRGARHPGRDRQVPGLLCAARAETCSGRTGACAMSGTASCREIRHSLGVYVLGAIEPGDRARVDEHLATCADCREELASLAGLPALLRRVPTAEAERLAVADPTRPATDGTPADHLLPSVLGRTGQARRAPRARRLRRRGRRGRCAAGAAR